MTVKVLVATASQHVCSAPAGRPRHKAPIRNRRRVMVRGAWGGDAPGKARKPSYTSDGVKNGVARLRGEGNLRVKRSDP